MKIEKHYRLTLEEQPDTEGWSRHIEVEPVKDADGELQHVCLEASLEGPEADETVTLFLTTEEADKLAAVLRVTARCADPEDDFEKIEGVHPSRVSQEALT